MSLLRKIARAACVYAVYPISRMAMYLLSFLVPRRADLWVFGAWDGAFIDNPKYLYLWISANCPQIQAIWITNNEGVYHQLVAKGYKVAYRWSVAGVRAALRAKFHICCVSIDDVHFPFSGGSWYINLWHGVGLKNNKYAARTGPSARLFAQRRNPLFRFQKWSTFQDPDVFLSTSPTMSQHFARCFRIPIEHCPQLGYPRLDAATDGDLRQRALAFGDYSSVDEALAAYKETYVYMPTWRDGCQDFIADALPDFRLLSQALTARSGVLYIKAHRNFPSKISSAFSNIRIWPQELDIYPVLNSFDVLITDYSSILYDFIFLKNRGVILYTFDYAQYITRENELAFPFDDNVVGLRVNNFDSLCSAIQCGAGTAPLAADKLTELRERFWGSSSGLSSSKLVSYLETLPKQTTG